MQVKDVMVADVVACAPDDSLNRAAQTMWEHDCGVVPVVDAQQRVVGMITDRDICMAAYTQGRPLEAIRVREAMSSDVITCGAQDPVSQLALAMRLRRVRRVPVVDSDGVLVGIVSLNDLARRAAADRAVPNRQLRLDEVGETLASVCQPWCAIDARRTDAAACALPPVESITAVAPSRNPAGSMLPMRPGPRSTKATPRGP